MWPLSSRRASLKITFFAASLINVLFSYTIIIIQGRQGPTSYLAPAASDDAPDNSYLAPAEAAR